MNHDEIIQQRIDDRVARIAAVHQSRSSWGADVGKPTVAEELAAGLRWPFEGGKALYPGVNIAQVHTEIPLIRRLAASVKIAESATPAQSP